MPLIIVSFSYCVLVHGTILLGYREAHDELFIRGFAHSQLPGCCYSVFLQLFPRRYLQPGHNVCILSPCLMLLLGVLAAPPEHSSRTETAYRQSLPFCLGEIVNLSVPQSSHE